ncbi:hypothetical protein [Ekhidna sp. To15]|uniref:hypothetical protein n=1 Tax=Ekhidna sp. To15 TaxID=3395267 RepID=UPI003F51B4AF
MKPINDNELREILSKKIASARGVDTDHLWAEIESSLSSSSSGFMSGILKCILFVSSCISVITISDSSGFAREPLHQDQTNLESLVDYSEKSDELIQLYEGGDVKGIELEAVVSLHELQREAEVIDATPPKVLQPTKSLADDIQPVKNKITLHEFSSTSVSQQKIEVEARHAQASNYFIAISPYLSYHSMLPHAFDENYIVSSASNQVTPAKRLGLNVSIGYMKHLSQRWMFSGSLGFDYYQTQFGYSIANHIDSDVLLTNHRIDGGVSAGIGYRLNTPLGQSLVLGESWFRYQIYDFHENSSYNQAIAGYRLAYLVRIRGMQIGPTYGSFFSSMSNEMGQVKPQIFGFTFRKAIGKN